MESHVTFGLCSTTSASSMRTKSRSIDPLYCWANLGPETWESIQRHSCRVLGWCSLRHLGHFVPWYGDFLGKSRGTLHRYCFPCWLNRCRGKPMTSFVHCETRTRRRSSSYYFEYERKSSTLRDTLARGTLDSRRYFHRSTSKIPGAVYFRISVEFASVFVEFLTESRKRSISFKMEFISSNS